MTQPLDCEAVVRRLWAYLDGELSPETMEAVREHLATCAACFPHAEFHRAFLAQLSRAPRPEHSDPERLRTRLVAALEEAGLGRE